MVVAPKVFISHSGSDKERFVIEFATKLREKGLNAWVDCWEILPGDSLVSKIFMEGLAPADVVVAVLSVNSISSKWVADELDAAHVKRIVEATRLIPVLLDDVVVPAHLRHLLWVSLSEEQSIDAVVQRIVDGVWGRTKKPPLGEPPAYTHETVNIPGLELQDLTVLRLIGEIVTSQERATISTKTVCEAAEEEGLSHEQIVESLEALEHIAVIRGTSVMGVRLPISITLTEYGYDLYLHKFTTEYHYQQRLVIADLANNQPSSSVDIEDRTKVSRIIIHHVLDVLKSKGYVSCSAVSGNRYIIGNIKKTISRLLD